jgi:hypothetical protein
VSPYSVSPYSELPAYLDEEGDAALVAALRRSRSSGRPAGAGEWQAQIEAKAGRALAPAKRGREPRVASVVDQGSLF